jgi:hypothetical protein
MLRDSTSLGKFSGQLLIDEHLYVASLDYVDDEIGDATAGDGWYGLLYHPSGAITVDPSGPLTDEEIAYLKRLVGVIVHEANDGHVTVSHYLTHSALENSWDHVVTGCTPDDDAILED